MSSIKRKMQRKNLAKKQKEAQKELNAAMANKMTLFSHLPEQCLACNAPFDKKSKEHAFTWRVFIKEESIDLYCPPCRNMALKIIEERWR